MSQSAKRLRRHRGKGMSRPQHTRETVNARRLLRLLWRLRQRVGPTEVSRRWGVSRAYIFLICNGRRKSIRMRESHAVRLEAMVLGLQVHGEIWRAAA